MNLLIKKIINIFCLSTIISSMAFGAVGSDPKEVFDTSKDLSEKKNPQKKTKLTTTDEKNGIKKTCETLKNGKILCTKEKIEDEPGT